MVHPGVDIILGGGNGSYRSRYKSYIKEEKEDDSEDMEQVSEEDLDMTIVWHIGLV